jgi:hypothetical protein
VCNTPLPCLGIGSQPCGSVLIALEVYPCLDRDVGNGTGTGLTIRADLTGSPRRRVYSVLYSYVLGGEQTRLSVAMVSTRRRTLCAIRFVHTQTFYIVFCKSACKNDGTSTSYHYQSCSYAFYYTVSSCPMRHAARDCTPQEYQGTVTTYTAILAVNWRPTNPLYTTLPYRCCWLLNDSSCIE